MLHFYILKQALKFAAKQEAEATDVVALVGV